MADEEALTDTQLQALMYLAGSSYSIDRAAEVLGRCQEIEEEIRVTYVNAQAKTAEAKCDLEKLQAKTADAMARLKKEFVRRHEQDLALAEQEQEPDYNSRARGEPELTKKQERKNGHQNVRR